MSIFIQFFLQSTIAMAEEGHSHGAGGETEHLWPVLAVFGVLVIGGAIFHFTTKKK